jgi:hypothetical protein
VTDVALPAFTIPTPCARHRVPATIALGALGGLTLGVVARAWMRLIAEDPAFTWSGTMFIVIGFTVFGSTQAVVSVTYGRARRRLPTIAARLLGVIGMLPLFMAAGAVMLPTAVGGGLALARVEWPRWARAVALAVAAVPIAFVGRDLVITFGWSVRALAGFVGLVAIYAVIARTAVPTLMRPPPSVRLPRRATITIAVLIAMVLLLPRVAAGLM